ncbi:unnamed protein product [Polarella glacialis]|uniref:Uncharacterized protein n=1 Tax=Polarella glacialis TaxID=89957 RepID=A0A813DJI4_POLGL|nr:unnamed protein product [Polarella glacialis]
MVEPRIQTALFALLSLDSRRAISYNVIEKWHYTIIDPPGRSDFIKHMIISASQVNDVPIMLLAGKTAPLLSPKGTKSRARSRTRCANTTRVFNTTALARKRWIATPLATSMLATSRLAL